MSTSQTYDKFRLRNFVAELAAIDEIAVHATPVALRDVAAILDTSAKAVLFQNAGPEKAEVVGSVAGSRRRVEAALGAEPFKAAAEVMRRLANPQKFFEVGSDAAPVHAVVETGDDVDLTKLPFHLQHEFDGGPYISSAIDYAVDQKTGKLNVGCRRLMPAGRNKLRTNLSQPSDLQGIYLAAVERGERLPVTFAIGSHPVDFLGAAMRSRDPDEFSLVATLRGQPMPMVRGVTNDVPVPADVEVTIEGYFEETGARGAEGPYGEFWGFYGPPHLNPLFHVTAITSRSDPLHQTVLHASTNLRLAEAANLGAVTTEVSARRAMTALGVTPSAICSLPGGSIRIALPKRAANQARGVIDAMFGMANLKHVVVVPDDVDVYSDEDVAWAMSARLDASRDVIIKGGLPQMYADPTARQRTVSKIGFDLLSSIGETDAINYWRVKPPAVQNNVQYDTAYDALRQGPQHFIDLVKSVGRDDRVIAVELSSLLDEGKLKQLPDGKWKLV